MNLALSSSLAHTLTSCRQVALHTHTRTTVPKAPPPLTSRHKSRKEIDSIGLVETFVFKKKKTEKEEEEEEALRSKAWKGRGEGSEEKAERGSGKATGTRIEY